jgi:hypothetical protein
MAHQARSMLLQKPQRLIFTPIKHMYIQELKRITTSWWERMKKMGIQNKTGRIVGTIVESPTPWLANGISQHLSN